MIILYNELVLHSYYHRVIDNCGLRQCFRDLGLIRAPTDWLLTLSMTPFSYFSGLNESVKTLSIELLSFLDRQQVLTGDKGSCTPGSILGNGEMVR